MAGTTIGFVQTGAATSGTKPLREAEGYDAVFAACLRNYKAQITFLAAHRLQPAVIGTGFRRELRDEGQMCGTRIAQGLKDAGYKPRGEQTQELVKRWSSASLDSLLGSKRVEYLMSTGRTGQLNDLKVILDLVDDVDAVFPLQSVETILQQYHGHVGEQDS